MLESTDLEAKKRRMLRIIGVLKSKMKEVEELEKEIKQSGLEKQPKTTTMALEEIIVPPLSVLKEKEKKI